MLYSDKKGHYIVRILMHFTFLTSLGTPNFDKVAADIYNISSPTYALVRKLLNISDNETEPRNYTTLINCSFHRWCYTAWNCRSRGNYYISLYLLQVCLYCKPNDFIPSSNSDIHLHMLVLLCFV